MEVVREVALTTCAPLPGMLSKNGQQPAWKFVPVILTSVPPVVLPKPGETPVSVDAASRYVKALGSVNVFAPQVSVMPTMPPMCAGVTAVSVELSTKVVFAGIPPKATEQPATRFAPARVTLVPPAVPPLDGVTLVSAGVVGFSSTKTTNVLPLLANEEGSVAKTALVPMARPFTAIVALLPAGMTTEAGTPATAGPDAESITVTSVAAGGVMKAVTLSVLPAVTLASGGSKTTPPSFSTWAVTCFVPPPMASGSVAVIVATPSVSPFTSKVPLVAPAGIVTPAGSWTTPAGEAERATVCGSVLGVPICTTYETVWPRAKRWSAGPTPASSLRIVAVPVDFPSVGDTPRQQAEATLIWTEKNSSFSGCVSPMMGMVIVLFVSFWLNSM